MASSTTTSTTTTTTTTAIEPFVIHPEAIDEQEAESFPDPSHGNLTWKTLISSPYTKTDSLTAGTATCPPKTGHLCRGIVEIDGAEYPVQAGTVVYIPGDAKHGIRNVDPERDLKWLYVFPTDGFRDVKYRFDES